jgi:hypothetical protein
VQSSYSRNEESEATADRFDTVQWWLGPECAWRIRTYAADLDIHLHRLEPAEDLVDLALRSTYDNYADVLDTLVRVELADYLDDAGVERELRDALGAPGLEHAPDLDMGFWNPGALRYATQSTPV